MKNQGSMVEKTQALDLDLSSCEALYLILLYCLPVRAFGQDIVSLSISLLINIRFNIM